MTKTWKISIAVIAVAIVVGVGVYYLVESTRMGNELPFGPYVGRDMSRAPYPGMSLEDYFKYRKQRINEGMLKEDGGFEKNPQAQGLTVLAKATIICPNSAGTPCATELDILAKDPVHSGNQEFYLASTGPGYTYYGPFTDNLQRIIDESKIAILTAESIMTTTTNWKTYTNTKVGFTFKYPNTATENKNTLSLNFDVTVNDLNTMEDGPLGYDKAHALKDKAALASGDPSTSFGMAMKDSLKMLNVKDALAKELTILGQIDICSVQFKRQAIIYKDNYQIILSWWWGGSSLLSTKNPNYFTTDSKNCGSEALWKDAGGFYADLVTGKTDALSQEWFTDFDAITDSFRFTK